MKKFLFILAGIAYTGLASAQQDPQFTQWFYDKMSFNPAVAGAECEHCLTLFHRDQWDGFDRDPKTYLFNYNGYVPSLYRDKSLLIGVGATFMTEVLGQEKNNIFRASFSYHHPVGQSFIAGGISLGAYTKQLGQDWRPINPDDNAIPDGNVNDGTFDLGLGVYAYQKNKYYVGASMTHLTAGELDKTFIKTAQHFYLMGGYNYDLNGTIMLRGNALLKSDLKTKPAFDINVNALWNNTAWGGLSFRPGDAIAPMAGFMKDFGCKTDSNKEFCHRFLLGYSYDVTTSEIRDYSAGSHEFFITYCFNVRMIPPKQLIGNPRFL